MSPLLPFMIGYLMYSYEVCGGLPSCCPLIWKAELYLDFLFLFSFLSGSHHRRCTSHAMVVRYLHLVSASFRTVTKVAQAQILSVVSCHTVCNASCGKVRGIAAVGSLQLFLCTGLCRCWRQGDYTHTSIHGISLCCFTVNLQESL